MSETTAVTERGEARTFPGMLVEFKQQIAAALPKHINADRMARIALTAFRLNPTLGKCPPESVFAGVIQSAQLGLEIGLNGRAYLVPYFNNRTGKYECQFIPGWKGLLELVNRTGRASCWTGAHFIGDPLFEYELGDSPFVKHKPGAESDPARLLHAYAVGRIRDSEYPVIEVWSNERIRAHFKRYNKVGDKHYAHGNWEMYARKVPLLQVLKYMPSSPELETAIAMSYAADAGQSLNIKDAIEGTFAPLPEAEDNASDNVSSASRGLNESAGSAPPPSGKAPTFAQVAEQINKAKGKADVATARKLAEGVVDKAQRDDLLGMCDVRDGELQS